MWLRPLVGCLWEKEPIVLGLTPQLGASEGLASPDPRRQPVQGQPFSWSPPLGVPHPLASCFQSLDLPQHPASASRFLE